VRAQFGQVLIVDNGGFFPEQEDYQDAAWFLMDAMKVLGSDAVGVSEKELRYGRGFLLDNYRRTKLPLVCSNLIDNVTKKPLVAPYVIKKVGGVTVGIFGLTSDKADLGAARDSVTVLDPVVAGKRTIDELRKKGATVIVLLSMLGKIESEDFVTAVDSVDVVICGRNVPVLQKGRMVKNTIACYGGEQGQYMGRTIVTLDSRHRMTAGDNETAMLSPEVGEKPEVLALVKAFEDSFNDKLRKKEKEKSVKDEQNRLAGGTGTTEQAVDHYLGAEFCQRCHKVEYDQWKTTKHSVAWQTLVDAKKDANPDCIGCHVVGYKQAGGFQTGDDAARAANVQCENCHGMGTQHDAFPTQARRITAATCQRCHTPNNSPTFDFAIYQPHILHHPPANMPPLPKSQARERMLGSGK
jgi:hypothetical protein